ncbi:hypothetical protein Ocin01_07762 [Orchesella cincta]|uniref:Uncharacterized protein n=1 Tax=Orchesella cincta TaxID=48709 RepID=A0A1D2N115_ORCCI|nr:hypothetical protein Ocin01_07762 [Orchesella cincta]
MSVKIEAFSVLTVVGFSTSFILCCLWISGANGAPYSLGRPHLTLYDHEFQKGQRYHQDVGPQCYNLPKVFDDRASSIDTHQSCIKVCTERDCKGCFNMKPGTKGHFTLREIHLNDNISSFTQC